MENGLTHFDKEGNAVMVDVPERMLLIGLHWQPDILR